MYRILENSRMCYYLEVTFILILKQISFSQICRLCRLVGVLARKQGKRVMLTPGMWRLKWDSNDCFVNCLQLCLPVCLSTCNSPPPTLALKLFSVRVWCTLTHTCGGQRRSCRSWFSPSMRWGQGGSNPGC